jgi:hypothetical protein
VNTPRAPFPREHRRGDLIDGYRAMAADAEREREALEWVENLAGDIEDNPETGTTRNP